ncbi:threonine synthase, partial [Halobacteriales archaeon QH_10_67_13]
MGLTHECPACGRQYDPTGAWRCACGHPLEFTSELSIAEPIDRERGVWA